MSPHSDRRQTYSPWWPSRETEFAEEDGIMPESTQPVVTLYEVVDETELESIRARAILSLLVYLGGPVSMHALDNYREYWWWDNLSHLLGGFAVGLLLPGTERQVDAEFLVLATIWETIEWATGEPYSMGCDEWPMDRKVEDTILDTIVGLAGARLAHKIRRLTA